MALPRIARRPVSTQMAAKTHEAPKPAAQNGKTSAQAATDLLRNSSSFQPHSAGDIKELKPFPGGGKTPSKDGPDGGAGPDGGPPPETKTPGELKPFPKK
jgi:hypothetical protein